MTHREGTIEELCNVEYGTRVVRKRDSGTIYPVYGGGGETFFLDTFNREDRVVIARFAMSEKCTRRVLGKFALNDSGLTLSSRDQAVLRQDFLDYYILSLNDQIYQSARGTAQKNLDVPAFRQMKITYPVSLKKQREIVEKLDSAFVEIVLLEKNLELIEEKTNQLSLSIMGSVFTPSDFGAQSNDLSRDEGSDVKNWTQVTLGDVFESITNGINCDQKSDEGKHSVTRIETISKGVVNFDRIGHADLSERDLIKYRLHRNDILFSHINSPIHVGKTAIFDTDFEIYHGVNLLRIRTVEAVNPKFLRYFLLHLFMSGYWLRVAKQSVNQASVNQKDISAVLFSYPSLNKQYEIVGKLDSAFTQIELLKEKIKLEKDHAAALRRSLLSSAFSQEEMVA